MKENIIIFDLEATCEDRRIDSNYDNEIIEIGAVKIRNNIIVEEFSVMVKPTNNPIITDYCFNLTGISQKEVRDGKNFENALESFIDFCRDGADSYKLFAWGDYDERQLNKDIKNNNIELTIKNTTNLKEKYANSRKLKRQVGLRKALNRERIVFEGRQHRALVDAKNTAKLFLALEGENENEK